MVKRFLAGGFAFVMVMAFLPAVLVAQSINNVELQRLALPVAQTDYPRDSYIAGEEGGVVLIATIGTDGQMSNARLETSSGYSALDEASIALANSARLPTPPTNAAGEPVSVDVLVDVMWALPPGPGSSALNEVPDTSAENLQVDRSSRFTIAYFMPGVDFSGYNKLIFEGPEVAIRDRWRRQHQDATFWDLEQIKRARARWFRDVFIAELQDRGNYQFVDEAGEDVMIIRAGIGDLDVAAPILRSESFPSYTVAEGGTAGTLVLELFDSTSGNVLARLFDRGVASSRNFESRTTRASNERDARVLFGGWAELLRARLEQGR